MNIVEPYARLVNVEGKWGDEPVCSFDRPDGIGLLRKIEWCGRISHRSEDTQTQDSWERFIRAVVLQHGDWSIVEHASVTVDLYVDRGIQQELTRHRLAAFTIESTRFVNYEKKMPASFIHPELSDDARRAPNGEQTELSHRQLWRHVMTTSESVYRQLLASGVAPQIARSVFPLALGSRILMTLNLRMLRHILLMRTTREAHPQMRQVMIPLLKECQEKIPVLFEDIEPMARQVDNIAKGR